MKFTPTGDKCAIKFMNKNLWSANKILHFLICELHDNYSNGACTDILVISMSLVLNPFKKL